MHTIDGNVDNPQLKDKTKYPGSLNRRGIRMCNIKKIIIMPVQGVSPVYFLHPCIYSSVSLLHAHKTVEPVIFLKFD